jgi:hypothetical protein
MSKLVKDESDSSVILLKKYRQVIVAFSKSPGDGEEERFLGLSQDSVERTGNEECDQRG